MDKKDVQDLVKAINNLASVIKDHNKVIDSQSKLSRENNDAIRNLTTRLASVANAFSNGGTVVNS